MLTAMLLAAVSQTAAPPLTLPTCSLVTPRGDSIGFFLWSAEDPTEFRLTATPGSAWPARTLVGTQRTGAAPRGIAIGGSDGFLLELGPDSAGHQQRSATLSRRSRQGALPVAYGFCEERPAAAQAGEPAADRNEVGADNAAFDPARWPQDCGLMLTDGRRIRFDFTLADRNRVTLTSPQLWSGRPVTASVSWVSGRGAQVGTFSRRGGPEGVQTMAVRGGQAVKLIRLQQIGEPSAPGLSGYGICGYTNIVRRPGS
jgi:hypothetical protein